MNDLYSNEFYMLRIGKSSSPEMDVDCYHIVNVDTGVVEAETTLLPKAIGYAQDFADALEELQAEKDPKIAFQH